jgi:transcriptional antiterminator Rof (Rho-off)
VVDVAARSGAEYMVLLLDEGQREEIRLDHIESISPVD